MMTAGTSQMPSIGRAKSCTACRQVKLACDARQKFPSPCSRCTSRKLECRLDANFKRVPTRNSKDPTNWPRRLEEVTTQLNDLRASIHLGASRSPTGSASASASSDYQLVPSFNRQEDYPGSSHSSDFDLDEKTSSKWLRIDEHHETASRSIEMIILTPETVLDLLEHFEQSFYPHIPILDPITSTSTLIESSPLLFWTIMLVSSQWHSKHRGLYDQLVAPHESLLSSLVHTSIQSLSTVHALLILCLWPVPKLREAFDPSWNFIGLAINAALQMGTHQPFAKLEELNGWMGWGRWNPTGVSTRTKALTWLACFNINIKLAIYLGMPPHLCTSSQLDRISSICREAQAEGLIPRTYAAHTELQRQVGRYMTQMDGLKDVHTHQSLTQMFDGELEGIKTAYQDSWTPQLDIDLQVGQSDGTSVQQSSFRKMILYQGLNAASRLVSTMSQLMMSNPTFPNSIPSLHAVDGNTHLLAYPKYYYTGTFMSAVFLLKFLAVQSKASQFDRELAINNITAAHKIFSNFTYSRDHQRAASLIEVLGRMTRSGVGADTFDLTVKNRLGASLLYDATFNAARYRNRNPVSGEVGPASTWLMMDDTEPLPPAPEQLVGYRMSLSNNGNTEPPDLTQLPIDHGWAWGMWENDVFDALMTDTSYGGAPSLSNSGSNTGMR